MDNGNPVWFATLLTWMGAALMLLAVESCNRPGSSSREHQSLPSKRSLLVDAGAQALLLELTQKEIVIRLEGDLVRCATTDSILRGWESIEALAVDGRPYYRKGLDLDPNVGYAGVVLGVATEVGPGEFEIRQLDGSEAVSAAVETVNAMLSECGVRNHIRLRVISVSGLATLSQALAIRFDAQIGSG